MNVSERGFNYRSTHDSSLFFYCEGESVLYIQNHSNCKSVFALQKKLCSISFLHNTNHSKNQTIKNEMNN